MGTAAPGIRIGAGASKTLRINGNSKAILQIQQYQQRDKSIQIPIYQSFPSFFKQLEPSAAAGAARLTTSAFALEAFAQQRASAEGPQGPQGPEGPKTWTAWTGGLQR